MTEIIEFTVPNNIPYKGGCVTEPALFALDHLVNYQADVVVAGQIHPDARVLDLLRAVLQGPAAYHVSPAEAQAARQRFVTQAGQALVQEGGQVEWLEKEFGVGGK
ncbi:hypothetical protein [Deinococcus sp.]|uniref:hypothetical protein n=1 Tax=Deinococcus sp. TaxID=47478 RepID=UPI0025FDFF71|nr:hypothetical protein [Deinococcus sp.]